MKKLLIILVTVCVCLCASAKKAEPKRITIDVIPQPQNVFAGKGTFRVDGANVNCDPALDAKILDMIYKFANSLSLSCGKTCSFATPKGIAKVAQEGNVKGFLFLQDSSLDSEEYNIVIDTKGVLVTASDYNGFFYAIQTIKQMLPTEAYGKKVYEDADWKIQCCTIQDKPRFKYRGALLDPCRHFFSVEETKRFLDIMSVYKLNRLHWHLSEDQGWRIEIKKYPRLTQVGAFRKGTMIEKNWGSNDGIRHGGFYTQEQIKDIIAYAAERGITIIPEIDLPGHMVAALASYPELGCTGGPYEVMTQWGVTDQVLCPAKPQTWEFLEGVLSEVADLFPSEYFNIGGDECPKTQWEKCPDCQALIAELGLKDTESAKAEAYLQNYVTKRAQDFLATKGKKIIGWDEILEGDLAPGATVMSWRGTKGGIEASKRGFDVIMAPNNYCYIDYYQSEDHENEPLCIGGYVPVEKLYNYEPFEGMTPEMSKHVLGVQANLWTEYIATPEHLEYMLLPRLLALSEVQWCEPAKKDYDRFKDCVISHEFPIFDIMGYTYAKHLIGISGREVLKLDQNQ